MASKLAPLLRKTGLYHFSLNLFHRWQNLREQIAVKIVLPLAISCSWIRKIHYGLFSNSFNHEMYMYAHARLNYLKSKNTQGNEALLRRQIHGLEKGLMIEPRKPVFALDYIQNTTQLFASFARQTPENHELLDWCYDVLQLYFQSIFPNPVTQKAKSTFDQVAYQKKSLLHFTPYQPDNTPLPETYANMFSHLAQSRKSIRWFLPQQPPRILLDKAMELALLAPSSCNRQPYAFRVFDDHAKVQALMQLAPGAGGFREQVPVVIAVIGKMNVSPSAGDKHLMYIDSSLASMNLMLALQSIGIGTCAINWPDLKKTEKAIRKIITLEPYERPVMLIAAGYAHPGRMVACSSRKSLEEIRTYNQ